MIETLSLAGAIFWAGAAIYYKTVKDNTEQAIYCLCWAILFVLNMKN